MIDSDAQKVLEAVLFSSSTVLTAKNLATVVGNLTPGRVSELVGALNSEYEQTNRTFRIVEVAGGYQMRTLPLYRTWVQKSEPLKPVRLTQPAMETLAIVAYRQPVTRATIEHLRGVDCSHGLRALLERRLVRIAGKDSSPGRPILYATSREFLSLFNLNDLRELPTLEDFDLTPPVQPAEPGPAQQEVPLDTVPLEDVPSDTGPLEDVPPQEPGLEREAG
jgi:segregation and condensation protein B